MQNAKLRKPEVVGMGVFIGGGRQEVDSWGRGGRIIWMGLLGGVGIGFVLGLLFLGRGGVVFA